jgi:ABC-type lipoprotein release transport system permease subunit
MLPEYFIEHAERLQNEIRSDSLVEHTSGRIISMVMLGSARNSGAVKVTGVDPAEEGLVTNLDQKIIEGAYFSGVRRNPILISKKLAENYKVKLKSKLVLTMQDVDKEITSGSFRVCGIFDTGNGMYDEMNVFVLRNDLKELLGIQAGLHEIAVVVQEHDLADPVATRYQEAYPDLEILSWLDLTAGMRYMVEAFDAYLYFIVGIILLALILSIINTMLMAVLERTHEIGMLMAIGMNKLKVFVMIMYETIFLAMIGGPLGLLLSYLSINYFGNYGIHLPGAAYGDMGFSSVIYPQLGQESYLNVTIMVLIMAVLAAIYPAIKALSLNPVEAIRKI